MGLLKWIDRRILAGRITEELVEKGYSVLFPSRMGLAFTAEESEKLNAVVALFYPDVLVFPQYYVDAAKPKRMSDPLVVTFFGTNAAAVWRGFSLFYQDIKSAGNTSEIVQAYWEMGKELEARLVLKYGVQLEPLEQA